MNRGIAVFAGLYVLLGGIVSLAGWLLDLRRLTDWADHGISIQPNAALCVIASGVAVLALAANRSRLAAIVGLIVLSIGGLTLLQWVSGLFFGIDELLMFGREWGRGGVVTPGRMGPPGSICWTLIGTALVLCVARTELRRFAPALALTTAAVSALSLIGYLYEVDQLYALPYFTVIALQTSSFIMAVSVGILFSHADREPMRMLLDKGGAGLLARRALPMMLMVPVVVGLLRERGQQAGLYDTGLGTALSTVILIGFLAGLMWWALNAVRGRERDLLAARHAAESDARLLEQRESRISGLLGSIADTFMSIDSQWRLTFINESGSKRIGKPSEELVGCNLWELLPEAAGNEAYLQLHRAMQDRTPVQYEIFYSSWQRWFFERAFPTPDGGLAMYSIDVTARKRIEHAVKDADRRKDEFLATLAHELRNPLAPIRNAVQVMRMKASPIPELKWAGDIIDRQVKQMTRLIDDLMDVSRLSLGKVQIQRERVDLAKVIEGAVELNRPLLSQCGHQLTVSLPTQPVSLDADATRLVQIFGNLLNNAAKYTERGGRIDLTVSLSGTEASVSIKDSGIGIPADKLQSVFEIFSQVQGALERSHGGLGIGLSLVKRLAEMHGGNVDAHSDGPGQGSEFIVRLPVLPVKEDPAADQFRSEIAPPALSMRILVVDDNRDAADSLGTMLGMLGIDVRSAYDGEDAVRIAGEFRPSVMLLDIGLPKLNGYQACQAIRQQPWGRHMVIIAVTGWGQEDDKRKARDAGFDHHMVKPVDPRKLIELLNTLPAHEAAPAANVLSWPRAVGDGIYAGQNLDGRSRTKPSA